jgi:transposase
LFRYSLTREAADRRLSTKQRGRLVRVLAEREHVGPSGAPVRVSRATIDRWIRDWRRGGFDALVPSPRRVAPRTPAEVLGLAVALKKEVPARTTVQVAAILRAQAGWAPNERTLQRHFVRLRWQHRTMGAAVPRKIGLQVHHKGRPDDTAPLPAPTGIDYLHLIEAQHTAELTERLRYSQLPDGHVLGQLALPGTDDRAVNGDDSGEVPT